MLKSGFYTCATCLACVAIALWGCAKPEIESVAETPRGVIERPAKEETEIPPALLELPPGFEELPLTQAQRSNENASNQIEGLPEILELPLAQAEESLAKMTKPSRKTGKNDPADKREDSPSEISIIKHIKISEMDGKTQITLFSNKTPEFQVRRKSTPPRLTLDLKQSLLSPEAENIIIPVNSGTMIKRIRIFQFRKTPDGTDNVVRILVDLITLTKHEVIIYPDKLILNVNHLFNRAGR